MHGYVMPEKPELKIREYELYSGYYCGLCKSVERRYGQLPRLALNYDSVFLALIIGSFYSSPERIEIERCPVHPLKKRTIVYDEVGVDYAADIMLLLAYFKFLDDKQDDGGVKASAGLVALKNSYKRLMKSHREKCIMIESKLNELSKLEQEKCPSLDRAAEPFAKLMEEVFLAESFQGEIEKEEMLRRMGYHIGKWIYLIDAFDDLKENIERGTYNPLIYQFSYGEDDKNIEAFRNRIAGRVEQNLLLYLAEFAKAWETIKTEKNAGLIENIIYFGLLRKTEQIIRKGNTEDGKPV